MAIIKNVKNLIPPVDFKSLELENKILKRRLRLLFKNPAIQGIRKKFGIPSGGFVERLGVIDPATPQERELNKRNYFREMSLKIADNKYLKSKGIPLKSRAREFQSEITELLLQNGLPERLHTILKPVLLYNSFSTHYPHNTSCVIKSITGKGEHQKACIVFDVDATKKDIICVWHECQRQFKLRGLQKGRWSKGSDNFLLARLVHSLHEEGVKDIGMWHKVKEIRGEDYPKLKDEDYVKALRQKYRRSFPRG